jgi:hypothetical protein
MCDREVDLTFYRGETVDIAPEDANGKRVIVAKDPTNDHFISLIVGDCVKFLLRSEAIALRNYLDAWCATGSLEAKDIEQQ